MAHDTSLDPSITPEEIAAAQHGPALPFPDVDHQDDEPTTARSLVAQAPNAPTEALAVAKHFTDAGIDVGVGMCLRTVRGYFDVDALWPDATAAMDHSSPFHRVTDPMDMPRGTVGYGRNSTHSHVWINLGGGLCRTTDFRRAGKVDIARVADVLPWCHATEFGWGEVLNGVDVWPTHNKPHPPKPPHPKPPKPDPEATFDISILSGRFDKADPRVAAAWQLERDHGASLLLGTELAGRDHGTLVGPDGRDKRYATLHAETGGPKGENAVQYAKADWTLEDSQLLKVWDGGGPGRFAHPAYALVNVLKNRHVNRELVDIQNHDPAHLFAGSKFFNPRNLARWMQVRNREAYVMRVLRNAHPDAAFMLSGDPNASGTFLARYMAKRFQGFKAANQFRFGAAWVAGLRRVGPVESHPTPSSDHPIQRVRLAWTPKKENK